MDSLEKLIPSGKDTLSCLPDLSPMTNLANNLHSTNICSKTSVAYTPTRRISFNTPLQGVSNMEFSPSMAESPTYLYSVKKGNSHCVYPPSSPYSLLLGTKTTSLPQRKTLFQTTKQKTSSSEDKENNSPVLKSSDFKQFEENKNECCSPSIVIQETFLDECEKLHIPEKNWEPSIFMIDTSMKDEFDITLKDQFSDPLIINDLSDSPKSPQLPSNLESLLKNPLIHDTNDQLIIEKKQIKRRCLSIEIDSVDKKSINDYEISSISSNTSSDFTKKPATDYCDLNERFPFKRPDAPNNFDSYECKRRKSSPCVEASPSYFSKKNHKLARSNSETVATVMHAILKSESEELIGDGTRPYSLPLIRGKHEDLKSISAETLALLLHGEYKEQIKSFVLIDCRYPYEYHGGHIQGAENIYTKDVILERFFVKPEETKGTVLIFHCEFSSERAPSLCRFVRNRDRLLNQGNYPKLNHPELYILDGGYKKFYLQYKELCEPQNYKPMKHKDHSSDLRQFRAKSKSWGAECKSRVFLRSSSKSDVI